MAFSASSGPNESERFVDISTACHATYVAWYLWVFPIHGSDTAHMNGILIYRYGYLFISDIPLEDMRDWS